MDDELDDHRGGNDRDLHSVHRLDSIDYGEDCDDERHDQWGEVDETI